MGTKSLTRSLLRVLFLEDHPQDALLVQHALEDAGFEVRIKVVDTREDFVTHLSPDFDVILSDHGLPQFNSLEALRIVHDRHLDIPFIILSGSISEQVALEAIRLGATDYLLKDRPNRLGVAVRNALRERGHRIEKERAFEALRRSERMNRAILASLTSHLAVIDQAGQIIAVNRAWEHYGKEHGCTPSDNTGVGANYLDACRRAAASGNAWASAAEEGIQDVLNGRVPRFVMEYPCPATDHEHWFEMRVTPLAPDDQGAVLIHTDITDRRHHEQQLVAAKEAAEEMARLKSVFLTNMSHEIRTPLTGILGFSELLSASASPEDQELITLIHESGKRLLETLNSVLELAQLEGRALQLNTRPVELGKAIRCMVGVLRPQFTQAALSVSLHAPRPVVALADPTALDRVLSNLISNAIKFTTDGGVTLETGTEDGFAYVRVSDTGIGIGEDFLPYLFDEFKQESTGLARQFEGVGIGLSIAKGLVSLMQGDIRVESRVGRGSTFTVLLPLAEQAEPLFASPPLSGHPVRRKRILLAEDTSTTRHLMAYLLGRTHEVDVAVNASETLAKAQQATYDLILLDIDLGEELSGIDLLHLIRQVPAHHQTPIVAFTAYALPGDEQRFLDIGFDGYLKKPFNQAELQATLQRFLVARGA